jgi:hypothetical protein
VSSGGVSDTTTATPDRGRRTALCRRAIPGDTITIPTPDGPATITALRFPSARQRHWDWAWRVDAPSGSLWRQRAGREDLPIVEVRTADGPALLAFYRSRRPGHVMTMWRVVAPASVRYGVAKAAKEGTPHD